MTRRQWASQCGGKRRYAGRTSADKAARRATVRYGEAMHSYFCETCKYHHIGHVERGRDTLAAYR